MFDKTVAIIDIGSNSVRLVVYAGLPRIPFIIFNEKVLAGLGEGLAQTGSLSPEASKRALAALRRFSIITRQMEVSEYRTVATAAVRDAANGAQFLAEVRALGFHPEMLSGEQEAIAAGQGVLSGIPDADGIVGDLGGGSLELVDIGGGEVRRTVSLPLGVLRLPPILADGEKALARKVAEAVAGAGLGGVGRGRPFYLVGGSWRSLARIDMLLTGYPLPIMHHYSMRSERAAELQPVIAKLEQGKLKNMGTVSVSRVPTLANGNVLLKHLVETLQPSQLIVSSFGIREGLLFERLDGDTRKQDPLLEAAREAGRGLGRFAEHGALLDRWIAPVFEDEPEATRLRLAACLLADVAWQAHPDFRAERGVDMALHGNWVGVDGPGRVMMAQALFSNFGGRGNFADQEVASLCNPDELKRASQWGLAMRLGQRLSGGVAAGLERSALERAGEKLRLKLKKSYEGLYGETVERRLRNLAGSLNLKPELASL